MPVNRLMEAFRRGRKNRYGWITIGGHEDEDGKHSGGTHVFIGGGGNITKGPSALKGKSPDDLAKSLKSKPDHAPEARKVPDEQKANTGKTQLAPERKPETPKSSQPDTVSKDVGKTTETPKTEAKPAETPKTETPSEPKTPPIGGINPQPETAKPVATSGLQKSPGELAKSLRQPAAQPVAETPPAAQPPASETPQTPAEAAVPTEQPNVPGEAEASTETAAVPQGEKVSSGESMKLFNDHQRLAESEAARIVRANPSASFDDLKQEALLKLWEVSQKVTRGTEAQFPGFAQTAIRNHLASMGRGSIAQKRGAGQVKQMPEDFNAEEQAKGRKGSSPEAVHKAVAELKDPQHRFVLQAILDGRNVRDIGAEMGVSGPTVSRIAAAAKELLRDSELYERIIVALDEKTRYDYGPRHQPPKRLEGAVARLEALAAYAGEIDDEALEDEVEGIAREFSAEDLKDIAKKFGVKGSISTKAKTLERLLDKVMGKERHEHEPRERKSEDLVSLLERILKEDS